MTLCRLILPEWACQKYPSKKKVLEGVFTDTELREYNTIGYGIYGLPNQPSEYNKNKTIDGADIDLFIWVFVDCDLKDGVYKDKDAFLEALGNGAVMPSKVVDSGNGVHAYWQVSNLDAKSYLRFQRRLMRIYDTDPAVGQLFQLMRLPNYINTKSQQDPKLCELLFDSGAIYDAETLDRALPPITKEDEEYCLHHYDKTYGLNQNTIAVSDEIPAKFGKLLKSNKEAKDLWANNTDDRSKSDYRLGHLMYANDFSKEEAMSVLVNSAKALQRAPTHRISYAENIINKIWTFETAPEADKPKADLSPTVRSILARGEETLAGTRFPCHRLVDDTVHGFRLGQVIGIIGGSGVGKTTLTLNTFLWFAERNPDYHHFFVSLEQPVGEIAARIRTICQGNDSLFDKIHIVSNYSDDGTYVHMSLEDVEKHLQTFQTETGHKVGAVVIDHIGVLAKSDKNGENDGLIGVCRKMKAVAVNVNVMLIMLSQAPREKAGIGDLELDKSAAYGTVFFESFVDYCLCLWQPLKRVYAMGAPTVMALKFAKIRHKKQGHDRIQEDICYQVFFDPNTERLRELTQDEETSAKFYLNQATNARKADRKTDLVPYQSRRIEEAPVNETIIESDRQSRRH